MIKLYKLLLHCSDSILVYFKFQLICETRPAHEDDVVKWDSVFAKAEGENNW